MPEYVQRWLEKTNTITCRSFPGFWNVIKDNTSLFLILYCHTSFYMFTFIVLGIICILGKRIPNYFKWLSDGNTFPSQKATFVSVCIVNHIWVEPPSENWLQPEILPFAKVLKIWWSFKNILWACYCHNFQTRKYTFFFPEWVHKNTFTSSGAEPSGED